ncbi:hypothetical protein [Gloeobacter morelensis]|uniref:Uncharacterized protein n=1 Tax=Gloeobacter morelensis MG652769 TaxID=2781736 RepID=A0ABY3PLW2_9CYAN|nr:hypothetical protein [Gloeobacter morelensis]UFP94574.1 hypothetical protein ISF26_23040 [Gloeobacter morelensis MG652769]
MSVAGTPFLPTRGTGYMVGAEADLLAGRLFANLALFGSKLYAPLLRSRRCRGREHLALCRNLAPIFPGRA